MGDPILTGRECEVILENFKNGLDLDAFENLLSQDQLQIHLKGCKTCEGFLPFSQNFQEALHLLENLEGAHFLESRAKPLMERVLKEVAAESTQRESPRLGWVFKFSNFLKWTPALALALFLAQGVVLQQFREIKNQFETPPSRGEVFGIIPNQKGGFTWLREVDFLPPPHFQIGNNPAENPFPNINSSIKNSQSILYTEKSQPPNRYPLLPDDSNKGVKMGGAGEDPTFLFMKNLDQTTENLLEEKTFLKGGGEDTTSFNTLTPQGLEGQFRLSPREAKGGRLEEIKIPPLKKQAGPERSFYPMKSVYRGSEGIQLEKKLDQYLKNEKIQCGKIILGGEVLYRIYLKKKEFTLLWKFITLHFPKLVLIVEKDNSIPHNLDSEASLEFEVALPKSSR